MASGGSASLVLRLYRKYQNSIETVVDTKQQDVRKMLQNLLTKEDQESLKRAKPSPEQALKKIVKNKLLESKENFLTIIKTFNTFSGSDLSNVIADAEATLGVKKIDPTKESTKKPRKKHNSEPSISFSQSNPGPISRPTSATSKINSNLQESRHHQSVLISTPSQLDSKKDSQVSSGNPLTKRRYTLEPSPNPRTVSVPRPISAQSSTQHGSDVRISPEIPAPSRMPAHTRLAPIPGSPSPSHAALAEPRLNSESYEEPCQPSAREFTGIQATSNHPTKKEVVIERQTPNLERRKSDDLGSTYPKPNDEMDAIKKLHIAMLELREHVDDEEFKEKWLAVDKSSIHLTTIYRDNIQKLKDEMQKVEQQAKDDKEYLLKEVKMLGESELTKKIQQKEAEIQQKNQEIQKLMASLEKAKNELNEMKSTLYVKQYTELEEKKGIVDKAIDSIRSRTPQDDKTQYKRTLSTSMGQVLALKDRPSTARF